MKRFLIALLTMVGLLTIVPATSAAAGPACTYSAGVVCGRISNATNVGIGIIPNWGPDYANGYGGGGYQAILWPGQNSSQYYQDTDGVHVGSCWAITVQVLGRYGWTGSQSTYGPANYKIRDANVWRVSNAWQRC